MSAETVAAGAQTDAPDWPDDLDFVHLDAVDSTMDEAARRPVPDRPTWIAAARQTKARGRSGRPWTSETGNFAATRLSTADRPPADLALYSFVAGLALFDTLSVWVPRDLLTLKWPNDVLVDGCKVAGILLESSGVGTAGHRLAIGIGINVASAPPRDSLPEGALDPIALADVARADAPLPLRPDRILWRLSQDFERWRRDWAENGFDSLRRAWIGRAAGVGGPIRVRLPNGDLTGTFETLDPDGCLVLGTPGGPRRIAAGEVFLP
ncbi:biotin--[acetyl-CoA-carboxylase] ligase [Rhodobacterales bacterium HKCCE2091]|nr:biotin--[acetyl-CoA-carboxylase] ligase [Rhodobacterales bacterium HKCCE2091]